MAEVPVPGRDQAKLRVVHDSIDTAHWKPHPATDRTTAGRAVPAGTKIVAYATRGRESVRGFDVFMRTTDKLVDRRSDVVYLIAGQDRVAYGGDGKRTGGKSFEGWVLAPDTYDPDRFLFTGLLPPAELAELVRLTDLPVYLTVPFVLSWSLLNAPACGATVLASDTARVREVIEYGRTGLLCDFFDPDAMADTAGRVLAAPRATTGTSGAAGVELVRGRYGVDICLARMLDLYRDAAARHTRAFGREDKPVRHGVAVE